MMLLTILSLAACGSSTDSDEPDINQYAESVHGF